MTVTKFEEENELSFEVPKNKVMKLLSEGVLVTVGSCKIEQKWCIRGASEGVPYSSRIRKTTDLTGKIPYSHEYTMKYYVTHTSRIEINSDISAEEYDTISKLHPHGKEISKTRLTVRPNVLVVEYSGPTYQIDIFPNNKAIIEVEFKSDEQRKAFKKPEWLFKLTEGEQ